MREAIPDTYLAIKDDTDVILCEIVGEIHIFNAMANLASRYYRSGPFPVTEMMLSGLRKSSSDPRLGNIPPAAPELPTIERLMIAISGLLATVKLRRNGDGTVSPSKLSHLVRLLGDPDVALRRPPDGQEFARVRDKLWVAAGKTLPIRAVQAADAAPMPDR